MHTANVYREQARDLPIIADIDIVIVGGGPSGLAAAVSAGKRGMKALIVERYGFFGGMAVAGLSGTIGGLYNSTQTGRLEQIVNGFAGQFVNLLRARNGVTDPLPFGNTALVVHDPLVWKETADKLIQEAGVHVMLHTLFVDAIVEEGTLAGIIVERKEGRGVIRGKVFIDASGDGDLSMRAGAAYQFGRDGAIQFPTMIFRMARIDWDRASLLAAHELEELIVEQVKSGRFQLPRRHIFLFPSPRKGEGLINCTRIARPDGLPVNGSVTEDLTWGEFEGRRQIREYERFLREHIPGFDKAYVVDSAVQIGIRQTRTIVGDYTLTNKDVITMRKFNSAVVRSAWPIEAHGKDVKIVNLDDDYYEIPYEVMLPQGVEQLLTVGRCISAEHEALASARVTAQCFEEGMAAGIAAVLSVRDSSTPRKADICEIRESMIAEGAYL